MQRNYKLRVSDIRYVALYSFQSRLNPCQQYWGAALARPPLHTRGLKRVLVAQDMEAPEDEEAEELAEMVLELEIAEFCNVRACKQQLPTLPYTHMFYSNTKIDGKLKFWR